MDDRRYPHPALDPDRPTGLLLCGMGGPDGPEAVEPFLRNLFADPRILPVPRWLSPLLGRVVSRRRAPTARRRYALMDAAGGSPQLAWTRRQAVRLGDLLDRRGVAVHPHPCFRYWHPRAREAVAAVIAAGAEQVLLVSLYPQFADAVGGSGLDDALQAVWDVCPSLAVHVVSDWHRLPGYLDAVTASLAALLRPWSRAGAPPAACAALLAAHSLPRRFVERGDPYPQRVAATAAAVRRRLHVLAAREGWGDWLSGLAGDGPGLAFQSRVGPIAWLEPDLADATRRLAAAGVRRLAVQPLSFTCEHIETLVELDVELKETAATAGIAHFARGPALNLDERWLSSLADHLAAAAFRRRKEAHRG